jgi:hypothetical protein
MSQDSNPVPFVSRTQDGRHNVPEIGLKDVLSRIIPIGVWTSEGIRMYTDAELQQWKTNMEQSPARAPSWQ